MFYLIFLRNFDIAYITGISTNNITLPSYAAVSGFETIFYISTAHTLRASNINCSNTQGSVFLLFDVFDHALQNMTLTNISTSQALIRQTYQKIILVEVTNTLAADNLNTSKPIASSFDNVNINVLTAYYNT